jgi:hypothetical protein
VYRFRGLRDRAIWSDRATLNVPWQFYALSAMLADVARVAALPSDRIEAFEAAAEDFRVVAAGGRRGTPRIPEGPAP